MGSILLCFSNIEFDNNWGERVPPENEAQRKARQFLALMESEEKEAELKKENKKQKPMTKDEEDRKKKEAEDNKRKKEELLKTMQPKPPIMQMLKETSFHDLLLCLERQAEYDRMLSDLGIIQCDFLLEDEALKETGKPFVRDLVQLPQIEDNRQYSKNPHI